jgi:hypothetical protein
MSRAEIGASRASQPVGTKTKRRNEAENARRAMGERAEAGKSNAGSHKSRVRRTKGKGWNSTVGCSRKEIISVRLVIPR